MIHFLLGTEAELIKVFPLMVALKKNGIDYQFISTGQHKIAESSILTIFKLKKPTKILYNGPTFTSSGKMFLWASKLLIQPRSKIRQIFENDMNGIVIVHGDTVSSAVGAVLAKRAGMKLAHIEAGMWSGNIFNPFPEEIDRRIVSWCSDVNFAPSDLGFNNLKRYKQKVVIHTYQNTQLDAFKLINVYFTKVKTPKLPKKYFIFILHRTENLSNKVLVERLVSNIIEKAKHSPCVFILHHTSEHKLKEYNLLKKIIHNKNIITLPRLTYPEFIKVLHNAEFLVTDGGGNQMEAAYIGIPTLLLRKLTESPEGIGRNVILSKLDFSTISKFFDNYKNYRTKPYLPKVSPTDIIYKEIRKYPESNAKSK